MYDLILQLVLMTSLAIVVYLMAAAVPRVEGGKEEKESTARNTVVLSLDKLDAHLNKLKDRALRRVKVVVMRTDNIIQKELNKEKEKL